MNHHHNHGTSNSRDIPHTLRFEVVESSETWGYKPLLTFDGDRDELTEREEKLLGRVHSDPSKVPDDAEIGDKYTIEEILDDLRTISEMREDAIRRARDIARKTGENIVIQTASDWCTDPFRECEVDQIVEYVTPFGRRETKRRHTTRHDSAETFYDKLDIENEDHDE